MSIAEFPEDILPTTLQFKLVPNSGFNKAENNMAEAWENPGSYWSFIATFSGVRYQKARKLDNFIDKLNGPAGEFMMFDSTHTQLGSWGASVLVSGAVNTGKVLNIKNAPASTTIAYEGDRIQLDNYLYRLREDAVTDASGNCELKINPQLITLPADSTPIIFNNPKCKMMLIDNNQGPSFSRRKLVVTDFQVAGFMSARR